jgi:hypothetical protein
MSIQSGNRRDKVWRASVAGKTSIFRIYFDSGYQYPFIKKPIQFFPSYATYSSSRGGPATGYAGNFDGFRFGEKSKNEDDNISLVGFSKALGESLTFTTIKGVIDNSSFAMRLFKKKEHAILRKTRLPMPTFLVYKDTLISLSQYGYKEIDDELYFFFISDSLNQQEITKKELIAINYKKISSIRNNKKTETLLFDGDGDFSKEVEFYGETLTLSIVDGKIEKKPNPKQIWIEGTVSKITDKEGNSTKTEVKFSLKRGVQTLVDLAAKDTVAASINIHTFFAAKKSTQTLSPVFEPISGQVVISLIDNDALKTILTSFSFSLQKTASEGVSFMGAPFTYYGNEHDPVDMDKLIEDSLACVPIRKDFISATINGIIQENESINALFERRHGNSSFSAAFGHDYGGWGEYRDSSDTNTRILHKAIAGITTKVRFPPPFNINHEWWYPTGDNYPDILNVCMTGSPSSEQISSFYENVYPEWERQFFSGSGGTPVRYIIQIGADNFEYTPETHTQNTLLGSAHWRGMSEPPCPIFKEISIFYAPFANKEGDHGICVVRLKENYNTKRDEYRDAREEYRKATKEEKDALKPQLDAKRQALLAEIEIGFNNFASLSLIMEAEKQNTYLILMNEDT